MGGSGRTACLRFPVAEEDFCTLLNRTSDLSFCRAVLFRLGFTAEEGTWTFDPLVFLDSLAIT